MQNTAACENYTWDRTGATYSSSGIYRDTVFTQSLCDSIFELNLVIDSPFDSVETASACGQYLWPVNGTIYSESGEYTEVIASEIGCDSTFTLMLTINQASTSNQSATSCLEYTWDANGNVYTESGNYQTILEAANGCDSTIYLNLTIEKVNVAVTNNQNVLSAQASGLQYQWVDCNADMKPIPGATNQSFVATENGNYAVIIIDGNCSDTSSCEAITTIGIRENSLREVVVIYPNPSSGKFSIEFEKALSDIELRIISSSGKQVLYDNKPQATNLNYSLEIAPGQYFVIINTSEGKAVQELIIK